MPRPAKPFPMLSAGKKSELVPRRGDRRGEDSPGSSLDFSCYLPLLKPSRANRGLAQPFIEATLRVAPPFPRLLREGG